MSKKEKVYNPFTKEFEYKERPERLEIPDVVTVKEEGRHLSYKWIGDRDARFRRAARIWRFVPKWLILLWGAGE